MKKLLLATLLGLLGATAAQAASVGYSSITATAGVTGTAFAGDGIFPVDGTFYQTTTAYWFNTSEEITFAFDGAYKLTGLSLSVDNNDYYRVLISTDGNTWQNYHTVLAFEGVNGAGVETFTPSLPATADAYRFAKVVALAGDSAYALGELQFTGTAVTPVPEASTVAMMLAGLGVLGAAVRRRQQR